MASKHTLTTEEREFFRLVSRAAFANPFSEEREKLDQKIGGAGSKTSHQEASDRVTTQVSRHLSRLDQENRGELRTYGAEDAALLKAANLFNIFHRYLDAFDQLIYDEALAGSKPRVVRFARNALNDLGECGCSETEAVNFFGLFYQLRRAYFLIYRSLIGPSVSMARLRLQLWQNVFTHDIQLYQRRLWNRMEDFSTILLGETGTGKGAAAAAIGRSGFIPFDADHQRFSTSFTDSFISINLSQFSEALLESELFGHRKGAFTGAIEHHDGILTRCSSHGAIFLDEIGDVSTPAQIKLLKVLEERIFSPVGSHERLRFEGRIIAATHYDIYKLRTNGSFRDDFYYRLSSDCIHVPPLRQRIAENADELAVMLRHLTEKLVGDDAPELVQLVYESLQRHPGPTYPWPGNVRELEQAVRRIILNRDYQGDVRDESTSPLNQLIHELETGPMTASTLLNRYCDLLYQRCHNYVEVSRLTGLDRRTVKKHVEDAHRE